MKQVSNSSKNKVVYDNSMYQDLASTLVLKFECFGNFIKLGRELKDLVSGQSLQHMAVCDHPVSCLAFGN